MERTTTEMIYAWTDGRMDGQFSYTCDTTHRWAMDDNFFLACFIAKQGRTGEDPPGFTGLQNEAMITVCYDTRFTVHGRHPWRSRARGVCELEVGDSGLAYLHGYVLSARMALSSGGSDYVWLEQDRSDWDENSRSPSETSHSSTSQHVI